MRWSREHSGGWFVGPWEAAAVAASSPPSSFPPSLPLFLSSTWGSCCVFLLQLTFMCLINETGK